ncbi:restriction endonuclease subunit S [Paenibacillus sp. 32O-W]|uniref:restriction endonuclease subunit S n=1 Tax=Paenibacillus sp. 32O-W TaxID=1695218 RepID=UPI0011A81DDC|nr:restriction endonuclease subunit S [Paenibacillus sp. 32O-W]
MYMKLGNLCNIVIGRTPSRNNQEYWGEGHKWVSISDMESKYIYQTKEQITERAKSECNCTLLPKGTLIMSFKLSIGKLSFLKDDMCTNEAIAGLIIKDKSILYDKFLYYALKVLDLTIGTDRAVKGMTLNKEKLNNILVFFPSYNEQIVIVEILDKAQALIDKRKQAIAKLDELVQAVFFDMFGDLRLNTKCWDTKCLSEIAEVSSGVTKGKKYNDAALVSVPYMRVANVQDGYVDISEIKEIEVSYNDSIRYRLQPRDVLLTEGGDPDKLGRGAVWTAPIKDCIHQNHIFRVRVNEEILNPYFLSACASSDYGKNYFLKMAKQTTGIATINMTQLKSFVVFLPPIELQNQFEQLVKTIEMEKQQMKFQLQQLESNFQALLQKAFKGELTVKDGVTV